MDTKKNQKGEGSVDKNMKIQQDELQDGMSRGLCYNCNEKYFPGHDVKSFASLRLLEMMIWMIHQL